MSKGKGAACASAPDKAAAMNKPCAAYRASVAIERNSNRIFVST